MPQQSALEYIRHGQTPFFRLPMADLAAKGPSAYAGADVVLLGVPYDSGTTYQPGARLGPYHLRRTSALVESFHPGHKLDVFERLRALDGGNVVSPPFNAGQARELVQVEVATVLEAGAIPFLAGGDHSITLPALRAIAAHHGPVAVVHVDAHFDTSGPEVWGEPHHHGTPIRHALTEGHVKRGHLFQIGMRGGWKDSDERALSDSHDARIYPMDVVDVGGVGPLAREIRDRVGDGPVYLTVDIDGIDPAFAPGTGTPVPGGLTSREALRLVRELAGVNLCGMDLVEVCPALDHADITCHLGAALLFEGLALAALGSRK
jgi:agmatinase